jgi:hypothetical protein
VAPAETGTRAVSIRPGQGCKNSLKPDCDTTADRTEPSMSQSKSLQTKRRKQKGKKHLAKLARQAKKLRQKTAK